MAVLIERKPGDRCGSLTMIKEIERDQSGHRCFLFRCSCGQKVRGAWYARSCYRCHRRGPPSRFKAGDHHGRLEVVAVLRPRKGGKRRRYRYRCHCGKVFASGTWNVQSCGCLRREAAAKVHRGPDYRPGDSTLRRHLRDYWNSAKVRGLEFQLSLPQFRKLVTCRCYYCGEAPRRLPARGHQPDEKLRCNGIDRKDSRKGYILGNCVPCCPQCNYAKRHLSVAQFVQWLVRASNYIQQKARL